MNDLLAELTQQLEEDFGVLNFIVGRYETKERTHNRIKEKLTAKGFDDAQIALFIYAFEAGMTSAYEQYF